jgi:hypothetical protein
MIFKKMITLGTWGSVISFALAFCNFPLQAFGTGKLVQVLWWTALWTAAGSAVVLIGSAIGIMVRSLRKNTSMDYSLYPWLVFFLTVVA